MVEIDKHGYFDYKHWPTPDELPNCPKVLDDAKVREHGILCHGSVNNTLVGRRRCISIVDFDR